MNTSVSFKNFLVTALLVVFSLLILGSSFIFLGRSYTLNDRRDRMAMTAGEISRTASAFASAGELDSWDFRLIISAVSKSTDSHIFVTDYSGLIVSSSEVAVISPNVGKRISSEIMGELWKKGEIHSMTTLGRFYGDDPCYVVALPVVSFDTVVGYVFVASNWASIIGTWNTTTSMFIITSVAVLLVAVLLSYLNSKRQTEPLMEMAIAARRFARGDFSVRVTDQGRQDEIGALTESFNIMADSLEKAEQRRSEFIANISHELKTPMTAISGFADGILDGTIPKDQQDKYLQTISSETKRLARLVREMLQVSRTETVDTKALLSGSFDLTEVIGRTLLTFEDKINAKNLDVDVNLPDDSIIVRGDEDSFTQVVYNLLDNAVKFADSGSVLSIMLWKKDGKAYVSVKNRGECIAQDELPFIFDRFRKTDKSRSKDRDGVGLGLSIVKAILINHEEDISVTSKDGYTEFIFTAKLKS